MSQALGIAQDDAAQAAEPALVIDLDRTLVRTDLLLEATLAMLRTRPLFVLLIPLWLLRGRAYLKKQLAARGALDVARLPYREDVLELAERARDRGRRVLLATASDHRMAEQVAAYLGLFDGVLGSDHGRNLKGAVKAAAVQAFLGGAAFDYAGDAMADLAVWRVCRTPIVVGGSRRLVAAVARLGRPYLELHDRPPSPAVFLRLMRVHQWLKNSLVFVPVLAGQQLADPGQLLRTTGAFLAFSLCASAVYVLNDLVDLEADRAHVRKRHRPLASGQVTGLQGLALIPILLSLSAAFCAGEPPRFTAVLAFYLLSTSIYSLWAKQRVVVDVIVLAGLYTLRVLAGSAATGIEPSFWLLALSDFIFLSLALSKRYCELLRLERVGGETIARRGYLPSDMPVLLAMGTAAGTSAVLMMALYINSPDVLLHYSHPRTLWLICPLLLFWLTRVWMKANRSEISDDPVVWAATDPTSLITGAICALTILLGNR